LLLIVVDFPGSKGRLVSEAESDDAIRTRPISIENSFGDYRCRYLNMSDEFLAFGN